MLELMLPALVASLILVGLHAYLGIHIIARGVIFVDLALAQTAAMGWAAANLGVAAALSGWLASEFAPRDVLVAGGATIALLALLLTALFVRDTADHVSASFMLFTSPACEHERSAGCR